MKKRIHTPDIPSRKSIQASPCKPSFPLGVFAFSLLLVCAPSLAGEIITFPGNGLLRDDPVWSTPQSIFPVSSLSNNTVTVSSAVSGFVFGGVTNSEDNVTNNSVFINGVTVGEDVYGGWTQMGDSTGNRVTISGGTVQMVTMGGYSYTGSANSNAISITGGTVHMLVGGYSGGDNASASANGNRISITGGRVEGDIYGGWSYMGDSAGNRVMISGGTVTGMTIAGSGYFGSANGNEISITGGTVHMLVGGYSTGNNANGNRVSITGGTVEGDVTGGSSSYGNANGNTISITGGRVNGKVVGGEGGNEATQNTVTIGSGASLANSSNLAGSDGFGGGDQFTGNTLNLLGWQGSVARVQNFQNLNFLLPTSFANNGTMMTVTGIANLTEVGGGIRSSIVNVDIMGGGRVQQVGESFTLINAATLTGTPDNTTAQGKKGLSLLYDFNLAAAGNQLTATVAGISVNPQTKALAEGRAAGSAFLNQGSDNAIQNLNTAMKATEGSNTGMASFGAVSGGRSRINSGSHVDVDGVTLILGAANNKTFADNSTLLMGAFVEGGTGSYNSYNSFSNAASVNGKGNTDYIGLGALGRYSLPSKLYFEASVRTGRSKVDFNSSDLVSATGENASYNARTWYHGMHGGVGYELPLNTVSTLDISGKVIWTHQGSDSVTIAGDPVRFDSSDSLRSRLGARYNTTLNNKVTAYAGAAWEYEFDGKAKASTYGRDITAPSVRGGTGIGEIGVRVKPEGYSNISFDLALQGYTGKREGATGSAALRYTF